MTDYRLWITWALLLILQNASFTWVSRARNSGSITWHGLAAIFSNGIWIFSQAIVINLMLQAFASKDITQILWIGSFYTVFTVLGSIGAHYILRTYLESGNRKVGA